MSTRKKGNTGEKPLVGEKRARGTELALSTESMKVCWHIGLIDHEGPFGWGKVTKDYLFDILDKAKCFESMTWSEVKKATHGKRNKSNNHFVPVSECTREARERFKEIFPVDQQEDEIFCFRVQGECRIWGIVKEHVFKVLWLDPGHQVCKSGSWR